MQKPVYLSFGAGVQSSALLCLAEKGVVNGIKSALFADTGSEPEAVYNWLDFLKTKIKKIPIHILRTKRGNLHDYALSVPHNPIPLHGIIKKNNVFKGVMGKRSCTYLFKIMPVYKKIRELEGYKKYQRLKPGSVQMALGISRDEINRAKPSRVQWVENVHPLLDMNLTRANCKEIVFDYLGKYPPRSACVFCPYLNNKNFIDIKKNKKDWERAVKFDEACRNQNKSIVQYVHKSKVPLSKVNLNEGADQLGFDMSCEEAHCGL